MREATQNTVARFQARLGWWQRTFRIPTVLNSSAFSKASSLWLALMALVGMQHKSPAMRLKKRSTDIHQSKKYRDVNRSLLRRLIHEPLEDRQLLATDVSVVSGNLVVNGDDAVNSWAFVTNGGNLTMTSSSGDIITSSVSGSGGSGTESVTIPLSAFTGTLGVNGLGGNDTIQVNGLTLLGNRSLSIDGGSGADAVTFQTAPTLLSGVGVISVSAETMITTVGGTLTTGIGAISLSVDEVDIQGEITSNTTVAIAPAQLNRPINLGINTVGSLGLTDAELDRVTAGTIQIGDGNTGVITVSGAITRPISTAMNLTNNDAIYFSNGSIDTLGGNLIFSTPTGISPASSGVEINTGASNPVQLSRNLSININGTGVDSGYNQFNVVGMVNINDAHLITAGTHIPVAGQTFTVIENDGLEAIIGTFHNLPQGATIGNFLNSGLPATISYTGGSGNDVVLTVGTIAPANIYTVDNLVDENDGVYTAGRLSLREAITLANASSGADLIKFNTSFANGPGLLTIQLVNALPAITGTVIIDGTSQPGYQGTPLINIHGNSLAQYGLDISNAANVGTVVKGLKFSGIRDTLIRVNNVDMVRLEDLDLSDAPSILNPTSYTTVGISAENGSDSIVITGVNASGMYLGGIKISNSNSPTIKNNVLKSADVSSNGALYLSSVYAIEVGAVSGNQFTGSSYGLQIDNGMSGLLIGDASVTGANIVIEDGTSGMTSVTSRALYLNNVDYVTIDNVDLSYDLLARSGEAVRANSNSDYLTVRNSNLANRVNGVYVTRGTRDLIVTNNNFTNNTQAIDATHLVRDQQAAAVLATGNIFTNSSNVFKLDTMTGSSSGLTIGTSGTNIVLDASSGITTATGTILDLNNVDNVTVTGVNMGYTGASRAGNGIVAVGSDNLSITGSTISNRNKGIQITGGGTDPVISNNNLSNDLASLTVDGAIDGADADTAPVLISGNTFTDSFDALQLNNMIGISIGTSGLKSVLVNPALDGLKTASGTIFNLNNLIGLTIDGMDLSYTGAARTGTGLNISNAGSRLVLQNFTIKNRNVGLNVTAASNAEDLTVKNNDLSNNNSALYIDGFRDGGDADTYPVNLSGNKFSGAGNAMRLWNMDGLTLGITGTEAVVINNATDGLQSATGTAIYLKSASDVTMIGLDLSYPGDGQSGTAIYTDGTMSRLTIKNVIAKNRNNGFRIGDAGQDLTLINNDLSNNNNALYISGFTDGLDADLVPVVATGTKFTGSTGQTLQIYNLTGQYIGTSASIPGIIINNATDGLNSSSFVALHVSNLPNSTIDGLNLSYPGMGPAGFGIVQDSDFGSGVTIQNVSATNRRNGFFLGGGGTDLTLINNDLSNNENPLYLSNYRDGADANLVPVVATGTKFSGSTFQALQIYDTANQYIGTSALTPGIIINNATDGLNDTGFIALHAGNIPGSTIDGLNLAYTGSSRSGYGLFADQYVGANVTIKNIIATNRRYGFDMTGGGQDLTLINNDVSNNDLGMRIWNYTDGVDADTVPIIASGNQFTNDLNAINMVNVGGQFFGTAGTGFIISNTAGGLNTVTGSPLSFGGRMENATIDGLDLSYSGSSASGNGIYYDGSSGNLGANVTIKNVTARNRSTGLNLSPTTGNYGTDLTLINNDVSNSTTGMRLYSFRDGSDADTVPIVASGNIFTNDGTGMQLSNMSGQFIGTSGTGIIFDNDTSGLKSVTGTALVLNTLVSVTVDGLDVSWNGSATHTGQGIYSTDSNNVTVTHVTASNRNEGVRIDGGNSLNINNSTFSNNTTGVTSSNVGTSSFINNNTIQANTIGVSQSGVVQVDGTSNYWGSAFAPTLNGSNGYTGDVNVGLNLPIAPAGAPAVPAYPPGNLVSYATTANPLEVTTNNDLVSADGSTSLREAIIAANVSGGNITFHAGLNTQTIRLISPLPPITKQVSIDGGGLIIIDGQFNSGDVFFVNGATASNSSILGLKIKGYASNGFGIRVNGATGVTLQNLDLSDPAGNFVQTGTGIQVENTSTDVVINNVNVSRTTNGIVVSSSDRPKVLNVNASFTLNGVQVTQSASSTITNVNASSTTSGIRVTTSANATVRDNTLNNSDLSLYLNGSTGLAVGAIRGNTFSGSSQAVRIEDGQSGLIIGNTSLSGTAHVVIEDGTSGMSTVTSRAIYLKGGSANATIDSLQLGFTAGRSGEGIRVDDGGQFLTIKNSNVSGRTNGITVTAGMNLTLTGNNLSNNGQSVFISGVTRQAIAPAAAAVTAWDNIFTNSANAIAIFGLTAANAGLTIGTTGTENIVINNASSGLQSVTGTAILLSNVDNVTINGIDLSYGGLNGLHRSGTGIFGSATSGSTSWTITNVNASNRTTGISVNGGNDLTLTGNTLVNNGQAISIVDVTKLAPASKAVFASGNIFTKSLNGLAISNLTGANAGLTIGTTGSENIVINNASSGLQSVTGTAINLSNVDNVTIVNVDVGFADGSRFGSAIIGSASSNSSFWTIQNVNASNRVIGISISGGKNVTLVGNNLSNDGQSINVSSVTKLAPAVSAVIASGNTFTNSTNAIAISTLTNSDLTIGTTGIENIVINNATDGLQSVASTAILLNSVGNVTITGVDLGYTGGFRSGAGIKINAGPDSRSTIQNVNASNRFTGIQVTGGKDLTANNNTLTNDGTALSVDSVTKSSLAASVIASGNTFANSGTALQLWNLSSGLTIGTANDSNIKIDNVNSGLQSNTGRVIYLSNISDVNIDGLDVGYNGSVQSGTGIYVDGTNNNNMIINHVTATNRSTGLRLGDAGKDLTVTNNNLSNNGLALYINNFSDGPDAGKTDNTVPVLATGNTFTGSTSGIELYNMTNQVVATGGTGIIVANTDGLKNSSATALRLSNMNGLTVSSLDLSYSGAGRSGTGIYADGTNHNLTITGVSATRRNRGFRIGDAGRDLMLTNNDLSNTNYGLFLRGYSDGDDANTVPVVASGNKFFGVITEALVLQNMNGLYIGTTGTGFIINNATDGLNSTPGVALRISDIPGSTIDGIDLSYSGMKRSGYGIRALEDFSDSDRLFGFIGNNVTIQNVIATNRDYGIYLVGGGDDLKLLNNNLSNNGTSLGLQSFKDGDDADNAPFSGTGNKFTGSTNGIFLEGMRNNSLVIGNSIAPGVNFVIDGNSGLTSVSGDALYLFNVNNVTIDGVDLSYRGFRRSGTGIRANDSFVNNLTLKNVTISNRVTGLTYNPNTNMAGYLLKIQDSNFLNNDTAIIAAQSNAGGYIRNSRIEGNDTGLVYNTDSSIILDAMGNYWGPGGSGAPGVNNNNGFLSNPANKVDSSGYVATIPAVLNRDYGDAPIAFAFSTSLAGFGARHIATGPMLGTIRDTEPDATGSTFANADSITATNDEEGVTVGILTPGANATATVFVTSSGAAKLDAWIDFNRDGDWDDDGEKIANSVSVVNGSNTITFAVPGSANVSLNYARFRISTAGGLDNFGEAVDGEVEDYVVGNIYVDDNWTNSTNFPVGAVVTDADPIMAGDQWGIVGLNALATVSGGLAAAAAGTQNQVIVNSGNYSTENANVTKAGLVVIFQEGDSTLGSLDDTISTAIVNLAGVTLTTGGTNLATHFDSSIVGNGNLIKDGSGKMTLAGDNTFTGYTTINDGTLALASSSNNNIASSPIITVGSGKTLEVAGVSGTELQLASGQTLRGTGTVTGGAIQALSSSTIDPAGSSTGILNTQSVVFASGSTFSVQVNGTTLAGTDYDQLNVTGEVNLGNATLNASGIVTSEGVPIVLMNNDGNDTVIGTFNGLAEKANVTINGKRFVITYQGGSNNNDVVLLSPTPINTVPSNQTVDEDVSLAFVAGVNGISVLDYDDNISTTKLTVTHGTLTIGSLVGGASISAGANNSSTLTLSGTQTQINAALATLSYKGNQDYNGPDSLVVVSTDAQNDVDTDTISISLTSVNDAPVAVNEGTALAPFGVVPKGGSLSAGPGVLNNDSDVDLGDLLTAVLFTNVLHGSLTLNANGSFNYRPTANYSGPDSFTYRAKDNAGMYSNVATVFLNVFNDAPTDILLSNNIVQENSNTVVDLAIGNLTSVDANVDDFAGFTLLAGLDEASFLISGSTLKLKAGVSVDFETRPSYRVNVRVTDGSGATFDKELTIFVRDLAEIASIQNNDGQVQRTMLTKLVVTFDTAVTIDAPGAFVVRNRNTNTLAAIRVATATNSSGKTVATITFASGANVTTRASANSLVDGNYELQIYGSLITSSTGQKVDAAKNGNSLGSNDVFGDEALDRFFRLFGDLDGDRDVDALDNAQFKPTLNSTLVANPTIYKAEFDFDGDGDIDALDNLRFRQNLNKTMPAI